VHLACNLVQHQHHERLYAKTCSDRVYGSESFTRLQPATLGGRSQMFVGAGSIVRFRALLDDLGTF
jgi:hypothetical protein